MKITSRIFLVFLSVFLSISYSHAQTSKTVTITTPGSLETVLGSDKNTITDLIVIGDLNSTDLATLKSMNSLQNLDMLSVNLPDNSLPNNAFKNGRFNKFILPRSLVAIGQNTFSFYDGELDFSMCQDLKTIGNNAFSGFKKQYLDLSKCSNLEQLGYSTFSGAKILEIDLSKNLNLTKFIYEGNHTYGAFNQFEGKVTLPNNLKELPASIFNGFTGETYIPDGVKSIPHRAFFGARLKNTLTLPASVISIEREAFSNYNGEIDLSKCQDLKTIGNGAFSAFKKQYLDLSKCSNLEQLGYSTFSGAKILEIDLSKNLNLTKFIYEGNHTYGAFNQFEGKVTLPNNLKELPASIFNGFTGETYIPDGITNIPYRAFLGARLKNTLTLPASVISIDREAFRMYNGEIDLSKCQDLKIIGNNAFDGFKKQTIDFSKCSNLEQLGYSTFSGAKILEIDLSKNLNLTKFIYEGNHTYGAFNQFEGKVTLPNNLKELPASIFNGFTGETYIPDGVKSIPHRAFFGARLKNTLTLPASVISIEREAFSNYNGEIDLSKCQDLKTIGNGAFSAFKKQAIDFSKCSNLEQLGYSVFNGAKILEIDLSKNLNLTKFIYEGNHTYGAFNQFEGKVTLPNNLKELPASIFNGFTGETYIPDGVKSIPHRAFFGARLKNTLTLPASVISIEREAFSNYNGEIDLSKCQDLKTIGNGAFSAFKKQAIDFSKCSNLEQLGYSVFNGAKILEIDLSKNLNLTKFIYEGNHTYGTFWLFEGKVTLPNNLKELPASTFNGFTGEAILPSQLQKTLYYSFKNSTIKRIVLPKTLALIGRQSFYNCNKLDTIISLNPIPSALEANVFEGVNKQTCVLLVPEGSVELYASTSQWQDFLYIHEIGTTPPDPNIRDRFPLYYHWDSSSLEGKYPYDGQTEGVKIGEYYWTNSNLQTGIDKITKETIDKTHAESQMFGNRQTCPNSWDNPDLSYWDYEGVTVELFNEHYGPYWPNFMMFPLMEKDNTHFTWKDNKGNALAGWRFPKTEDALQLLGMCGNAKKKVVRQYLSQSYDDPTAPAFISNIKTNAYYDWFRPLSHEIEAENWTFDSKNTNKYHFNMLPGGWKPQNTATYYSVNYRCENGTNVEYMHSFSVGPDEIYGLNQVMKMPLDGDTYFVLHDVPSIEYMRLYEKTQIRYCRPLTDEELGYKLYINQNMNDIKVPITWEPGVNDFRSITGEEILLHKVRHGDISAEEIDIIKIADLGTSAPAGYVELPRGYIRGFYVQFMIEDTEKGLSIADIINIAKENEMVWLNKAETLKLDLSQYNNTSNISLPTTRQTAIEESKVNVYPNPAENTLYIDSTDEVQSVKVYSTTGSVVISTGKLNGNSIDVSSLTSGMYVVKVQTEGNNFTQKVFKK